MAAAEHEPRLASGLARVRKGATQWLQVRRERGRVIDFAVHFYERDRDVFASVLGSAIAMRVFLFLIPCVMTLVGLLNTLGIDRLVLDAVEASKTTGGLASDIEAAATTSSRTGLGLLFSGFVLALWTGRSLAAVLAACSRGAWQVPGRELRSSARMVGRSSGCCLRWCLPCS